MSTTLLVKGMFVFCEVFCMCARRYFADAKTEGAPAVYSVAETYTSMKLWSGLKETADAEEQLMINSVADLRFVRLVSPGTIGE